MAEQNAPLIFDTSDGQQLRINMIGSWLRGRFGRKIIKLAIDGGFTCPNRDGTKGTGGCVFCSESGSGEMASRAVRPDDISRAMQNQVRLLSAKWPDAEFIPYFQSYTNTYAPPEELREKYLAALNFEHVAGLAVATRPDCVSDEVLDVLDELNRKTFLWVELGLQTIHDQTARTMNLCHTRSDYDDALAKLSGRGIRTVTHLILGLPGETEEMMLDSVRYVCRPLPSSQDCPAGSGHIFGIKLHMLNVVRGSAMETAFPGYVPFSSIEEYTDLLIAAIELVPPDITVHRISGDAPRSILIAPEWSYKKRTILNGIHREMRRRNTWQGKACL